MSVDLAPPTPARRFAWARLLLAWAPLARLGKASLAIFVWHMPVILFVSRHSGEWGWATRTAFATVLLVVVVVAAERWIEEPTRHWLATHLRAPRPPTRSTTAPLAAP